MLQGAPEGEASYIVLALISAVVGLFGTLSAVVWLVIRTDKARINTLEERQHNAIEALIKNFDSLHQSLLTIAETHKESRQQISQVAQRVLDGVNEFKAELIAQGRGRQAR